jgi:SAM-dependent methyltransferase
MVKSLKKNHTSKKLTKKIKTCQQLSQNIAIYWHHKLSRSWAACDFLKNMDLKCNTAPVTGRGIESYKTHLFPDVSNIFKYLKNKRFLDIGCGINHVYKNALLYKLIQKKYNATGLDLYKFPNKHPNFVSRNIMNTKLKPNYYDTITSQYFLYYWMDNPTDLLKTFKELHRIMKKNGTLRIYPVYYGNYHYNNDTLISFLDKHFTIKLIKPKFIKEKVAYIYPGETKKDIKLTDNSVPVKEAEDAKTLEAHVVIFSKN